eukprot:m.27667 g.27667  ORF g.27667 m.27667 type:complete len:257 (-) comp6453_c0_seq1:144-914(-)
MPPKASKTKKKASKKGAPTSSDKPKKSRANSAPVVRRDPAAPKPGSRESLVRSASRIGGKSGIDWAALDRASKQENTMNHGMPFEKKKPEEHSKIFKALNPEKLWKESAREKASAQNDENVIMVQVRGNDARTLLDQQTFTRDDSGAVIEDEDNDVGFGTAIIESGDIGMDEMEGILAEKRKEREAEAEKHRESLRQQQKEKDEAEKKRIEAELKKIAQKEAALAKKTQITDSDVAKTQKKLEKELEFEEFGFGNL